MNKTVPISQSSFEVRIAFNLFENDRSAIGKVQ